MDKYTRQSQKTSLWARRRNTTADLLLQGQLRYLERRQGQGLKKYVRGKFRLQEELRNLYHISDDGGNEDPVISSLANTESRSSTSNDGAVLSRQRTESKNAGSALNSRQLSSQTSLSMLSERDGAGIRRGMSDTNSLDIDQSCECKNSNAPDISESRVSDSSIKASKSSTFSHQPLTVCKSADVLARQSHALSLVGSLRRSASTVSWKTIPQGPCRFSQDQGKSGSLCRHFPCSVPTTYHALGFRGKDLATWSSNDRPNPGVSSVPGKGNHASVTSEEDSELEIQRNISGPEMKKRVDFDSLTIKKVGRRNLTLGRSEGSLNIPQSQVKPDQRFDDLSHPQGETDSTLVVPQWSSSRNNKKEFSFRPASGPAFRPKPSDPILERVRQGSTQAVSVDKQSARTTVEGRMRGLKALIAEMRTKHENSRPVDWATNYGQRLPMRVLLNPVVPVV